MLNEIEKCIVSDLISGNQLIRDRPEVFADEAKRQRAISLTVKMLATLETKRED